MDELKTVRLVSWQTSHDDYKVMAEDQLSLLVEQGYHFGASGSAGGVCWVAMVHYPEFKELVLDADQMAELQRAKDEHMRGMTDAERRAFYEGQWVKSEMPVDTTEPGGLTPNQQYIYEQALKNGDPEPETGPQPLPPEEQEAPGNLDKVPAQKPVKSIGHPPKKH